MYQFLTLLFLANSLVFSAELPRDAQRELDSFAVNVAKLDTERQAKLNALVDKAVKVLNEVAKKADTAEERRSIDDEILGLKKLRKVDDLLGDGQTTNAAASFVGRWNYTIPGWSGWIEAKNDGAATVSTGESGTWKVQGNVIRIDWENRRWHELALPLDPAGTALRSTDGKTGTAVKEIKK